MTYRGWLICAYPASPGVEDRAIATLKLGFARWGDVIDPLSLVFDSRDGVLYARAQAA